MWPQASHHSPAAGYSGCPSSLASPGTHSHPCWCQTIEPGNGVWVDLHPRGSLECWPCLLQVCRSPVGRSSCLGTHPHLAMPMQRDTQSTGSRVVAAPARGQGQNSSCPCEAGSCPGPCEPPAGGGRRHCIFGLKGGTRTWFVMPSPRRGQGVFPLQEKALHSTQLHLTLP